MKRIFFFLLLLLTALFLPGCSGETARESPSPAAPVSRDCVIDGEGPVDILLLAFRPQLSYVDARSSHEYEALLKLSQLRPDCEIVWNYEFQGESYPSSTTELKVSELDGLEEALRYLPALTYVDLIDSPAQVEDLDRYSELRPDIEFYWSFVLEGFVIRTDIQCYSTLRDLDYHRFTSEELYPLLKYCKHLKALDLGHNDLTDISLIGELDELEVLILADNPNLVDASPLAKLENLEYLEFFMNHNVEDYSFLNSLNKIRDLNLCYCDMLGDLDFLEHMPDISFGMFKYSGISQETLDYWQLQYPESKLVIYDGSIHSCDGGWRDTQRNAQIRFAFSNWRHVTNYEHYDDVDFDFSGYVYEFA